MLNATFLSKGHALKSSTGPQIPFAASHEGLLQEVNSALWPLQSPNHPSLHAPLFQLTRPSHLLYRQLYLC